ncbi:MAG: hypothetical protein AAF648_11625 [Pseudomonadota bacterium]
MLLELNDCCVTLSGPDGLRYQAAAYALVSGEQLKFGIEATSGQRISPLQSNNLFLDRLSAEPLPRSLGSASNHADLLYHQLLEIAPLSADQSVTVAVPSTLTEAQLSLFLGVAREARLEVMRFVDLATLIAASATLEADAESVQVLDVGLHHLTLAEVALTDTARVAQTAQLPGAGLHQMLEGWMNVVADRFIQSTRFDPLHRAQSEQQVFDHLAGWARLNRSDLPPATQQTDLRIALSADGSERSATVAYSALRDKTRQRLEGALGRLPEDGICLLSPRAAATPTLLDVICEARPKLDLYWPNVSSGDLLARAPTEHPELFATGGGVELIKTLDRRPSTPLVAAVTNASVAAPVPTPAAAPTPDGALASVTESEDEREPRPAATHLLCDGVAIPIERSLFELGIPLARQGPLLIAMPGDEPLQTVAGPIGPGTELTSGARFTWHAREYQLICVDTR